MLSIKQLLGKRYHTTTRSRYGKLTECAIVPLDHLDQLRLYSMSGQTSPKVFKTAATYLAASKEDRAKFLANPYAAGIVAGWAASLTGQAPNRRQAKRPALRPTSSRVLLSGARPKR